MSYTHTSHMEQEDLTHPQTKNLYCMHFSSSHHAPPHYIKSHTDSTNHIIQLLKEPPKLKASNICHFKIFSSSLFRYIITTYSHLMYTSIQSTLFPPNGNLVVIGQPIPGL
jgi:hypothetical protein